MIVTKVIGGLGNQMFQYAAGYALAREKRVPLKLDIRDFHDYKLHQGFELSRIFNISGTPASEEDIRAVLRWRSHPKIFSLLRRRRLAWARSSRLVFEPRRYDEYDVSRISKDCYLHGYWQSERYFSQSASALRKEFQFVLPLSEVNQACANAITSCNAVSLHVRRGDYVTDSKAASIHGVCSLTFYREAVKLISERVSAPTFFVFSDDLDWARANIKLPGACHFVGHNSGSESYNDMRLMSMCRHHIIANSSFSWWGAWLNSRDDKIVIAPKRWFLVERDTSDIVPEGWIRL